MAELPRLRFSCLPIVRQPVAAFLLFVVSLTLPCGQGVQSAFAADNAQVREKTSQLEQVRKRIGRLQAEMKDIRNTRDARQAALERTDRAISDLIAALRETRAQVQSAGQQLAELEKEQEGERRKLAVMRARLVQEIRASYMAGRQQRVKLMLNQEDPASLARMLVYQGYFTRARTARMEAFNAALAKLAKTEQALQERRAGLERLQVEQQTQSAALGEEQQRQRILLDQIEQRLVDKSTELKMLQEDEQRLGKLVESLRRALQDIPLDELDKPLKSLKGKLGWPVTGHLARNYGEKLGVGNARSRGVVIKTAADTDVHAIAKGRVAFADWLRGFGLLMIIEHGDGYMSLYGRNNSLFKGVGEWVERGEVIAAAGNSGGQQSSALYLELRKDGRPIDPGKWFRGKPRTRTAGR